VDIDSTTDACEAQPTAARQETIHRLLRIEPRNFEQGIVKSRVNVSCPDTGERLHRSAAI